MKAKLLVYGGGALALLLLSIIVSLSMGSAHVPIGEVWRILLHRVPLVGGWGTPDWPQADEQIVMKVRLSRIVLGVLVGAALGLAGAGFQGILRNPLADPYTIGIASGASVGAAFIILFGLQMAIGLMTVPIVAFGTGLITLLIVLTLARTDGKLNKETLILSGVIVQAFLGAFVSFMVSLSTKVVNEIVYWLMGSLSLRSWQYSWAVVPYLVIGIVVLFSYSKALNLFALGERHAAHLGVHVERTKLVVLLVSTLLTAAAVSVTGVVGFVGLVVPHLVRLAIGPDYRILMPLSTIIGSVYIVWADTIARMALNPREIPLGVVTALIGAPFFIYLLRKQRRKAQGGLL
jgi:iron complex transport system permease protein